MSRKSKLRNFFLHWSHSGQVECVVNLYVAGYVKVNQSRRLNKTVLISEHVKPNLRKKTQLDQELPLLQGKRATTKSWLSLSLPCHSLPPSQ